jgi:uncharacterized damage-inducible protein DinB
MIKLRLLVFLVIVPMLLAAQQKPMTSAPAISPLRQELLDSFDDAAKEALALAKAIPEEKYSWRPMEGVRSFGEVFTHMAGSTLLFGSFTGMKAPEGPAHDLAAVYMKKGVRTPELLTEDGAVNDKTKVVAMMEQCFQIGRDWIRNTPDADLEKTVPFFGQQITTRALLMELSNHLNQHLGQSIAYARVNHIVPPWSLPKKK